MGDYLGSEVIFSIVDMEIKSELDHSLFRVINKLYLQMDDGLFLLDQNFNVLWQNPWMEKKMREVSNTFPSTLDEIKDLLVLEFPESLFPIENITPIFRSPSNIPSLPNVGLKIYHVDEFYVLLIADLSVTQSIIDRLLASEDKFRVVFEHAANPIIWVDLETRMIVNSNLAMESFLQFSKDELLQKHQSDLYPSGFIDSCVALNEKLMTDKKIECDNMVLQRKDKIIIPVDMTAKVIMMEGKEIIHLTFKDISDRKRAEEKILQSLKEKDTLLREIHHRVKNNLQIISAIAFMHQVSMQNKDDQSIFQDFQNRIKTISQIHEGLYRSENIERVQLPLYVSQLIQGIVQSYSDKARMVHVLPEIDNISLDLNKAVHFGLIINEILSFLLKAFSNQEMLVVALKIRQNGKQIEISIENNILIFNHIKFTDLKKTICWKIVTTSTKQLKGDLDFDLQKKKWIKVKFPIEDQ